MNSGELRSHIQGGYRSSRIRARGATGALIMTGCDLCVCDRSSELREVVSKVLCCHFYANTPDKDLRHSLIALKAGSFRNRSPQLHDEGFQNSIETTSSIDESSNLYNLAVEHVVLSQHNYVHN